MIKINKSSFKTYKFDDIAANISERAEPKETKLDIYVGLEHLDPDCIHIKRKGHPSDVKGTKLRVYPGDIIFGKRRAYQRKAGIVDFDGICAAHAMVVRANPKVILPELLPFFMHSDAFMHRAVDVSEGSLSPTIKWKILADQKFTIPSLGDQKPLADLLWSIDRTIESYRSLLSSIDACKKSALIDIGNKQESLREIGEVVDILDNQRKPLNSEQRASMKGSIPYYGANGIVDTVNDYVFDEDLVLVAEDGGNFHDYLTKTIAYMISGKSWVNNHAHVLKAKKCLRIKWLFYCLVHKDITKYIVGTTRVKLNQGALNKIRIYVPDIPEQDRLIAQIDSIFEAEKNVQNQISVSEQIKKQIINQIFE
jgi:type I restriction enzyme S subunit